MIPMGQRASARAKLTEPRRTPAIPLRPRLPKMSISASALCSMQVEVGQRLWTRVLPIGAVRTAAKDRSN
jgi:hypothetical protein